MSTLRENALAAYDKAVAAAQQDLERRRATSVAQAHHNLRAWCAIAFGDTAVIEVGDPTFGAGDVQCVRELRFWVDGIEMRWLAPRSTSDGYLGANALLFADTTGLFPIRSLIDLGAALRGMEDA